MSRGVALSLYVGATVLVAIAAVAAAAFLEWGRPFGSFWLPGVLAVVVCVDTVSSVRFRKAEQAESRGNEEALFVAMALLVSPLAVLAALAAGVLVGQLLLRRDALKGIFNLAQFMGAAALGLLVLAPLSTGGGVSVGRTAAVVVAAFVFSLANRVVVSGVLAAAGAGSFARDFRNDLGSAALIWLGNVAIGLLAGLAGAVHGSTLVFVLPAVVVLGVGLSGHWRARRERQTLADLVESSAAVIFSVDPHGRVRMWNPEMERATGRPAGKSVGRPLAETLSLCNPDGAAAEDLLAPSPAPQPRERRLVQLESESGAKGWLMLSRALLPDGGFAFVAQDITEQRQAQEALHENEERLRLALEAGHMGWWRWDLSSGEVHVSETYERDLGFTPGGFGGSFEEFSARLHPDDRPLLERAIERTLADGRGEVVYRVLRPDGTVRWIDGKALLLRDSDGRPTGMTGVAFDVTERREAEQRLRAAEAKYRSLVEELPLAAYIDRIDATSSNIYASPQIELMLGYASEEWRSDPDLFVTILHPDDRERVLAEHAHAHETGEPLSSEYRVVAKDGRVVWIQDEAVIVRDEGGNPVFLQGYMLDLTERKRAERALRESEERFRELFENASDMVCSLDESGRFTTINRAGETITGYTSAELLGISFEDLVAPDDLSLARTHFERAISGAVEAMIEEFTIVRKDGSSVVLDVSYGRVETRGGKRLEVIARDITERKRLEQELHRQAFYDSLTGLANRALFQDRVAHALARRQASVAVLYLDLDDFKAVNDGLGHHAGDRLLIEVADRLRACARPADTCARLGGDEFALLIEDLPAADAAVEAAERILGALEAPIPLPGAEVSVRASIGIALPDSDLEGADELLRNADLAMYRVKSRGKNGHETFEPSMLRAAHARLQLSGELGRALAEKQLNVYYQPLVELGSGTITGVEALARWHHPRHGLIPPTEFIPLAERTGLIIQLSRWMLQEACRQARLWQTAYPHHPPLTVSVNLSGRHLQSAEVVRDVQRALADSGLAAASLTLELTESVLAENTDAAEKLRALRTLGIRIALDDFGTGYSSLSYLQHLPIDILKIDKTFVLAAGRGTKERALASTIISLGNSLGLTVIAEGIERAEQRDHLYTLGCRLGQGFLFAPPHAPEELEPLLSTRVIEAAQLRLRVATSTRSAS